MRKSYVTPRKSENGFRFFTVAIPIVFLLLLLVGFKMLLNSIDSVAEKQELIISGLAISDDKQKKDAEPTPLAGEYVSKIEFVKYKNEKKGRNKSSEKTY